jgi:hypothetical protein
MNFIPNSVRGAAVQRKGNRSFSKMVAKSMVYYFYEGSSSKLYYIITIQSTARRHIKIRRLLRGRRERLHLTYSAAAAARGSALPPNF